MSFSLSAFICVYRRLNLIFLFLVAAMGRARLYVAENFFCCKYAGVCFKSYDMVKATPLHGETESRIWGSTFTTDRSRKRFRSIHAGCGLFPVLVKIPLYSEYECGGVDVAFQRPVDEVVIVSAS